MEDKENINADELIVKSVESYNEMPIISNKMIVIQTVIVGGLSLTVVFHILAGNFELSEISLGLIAAIGTGVLAVTQAIELVFMLCKKMGVEISKDAIKQYFMNLGINRDKENDEVSKSKGK